MNCPFCQAEKESLKVIDSRSCDNGRSIRRRRQCLNCGKRFTTYERIEESVRLIVVKKDGRRAPWDRQKLLNGLERSCFKRPVPESELLRICDEVEEEARKQHDREVPTHFIGEQVAERLRRLDQVAYVRFASVYKQFKTLEDLVHEAQLVIEAKRFDDPTQGRLFIDPTSRPAAVNGQSHAATERPPEMRSTRGGARTHSRVARPGKNRPSDAPGLMPDESVDAHVEEN
jgi:transcriptional repressor NrdR